LVQGEPGLLRDRQISQRVVQLHSMAGEASPDLPFPSRDHRLAAFGPLGVEFERPSVHIMYV
jgi:hypothetical protein